MENTETEPYSELQKRKNDRGIICSLGVCALIPSEFPPKTKQVRQWMLLSCTHVFSQQTKPSRPCKWKWAFRSQYVTCIIDMTEVQVNVNIPPHPTPAHPTKTRPEWETQKHAVPMGSGHRKTRATTNRKEQPWFFIAQLRNIDGEIKQWKMNTEPNNGGLEDDFPFQLGDF